MPNSSAGKGLTNKAWSPNHLHPERTHSLTVRGPNTLITAVTMPTEDEWQLYHQEKGDLTKPICLLEEFPDVWTEKGFPSRAHNHVPIMKDLKPGAVPVRQRQYSVPWEACLGIQAHLQ
jgi:hypothetical protein